MSDLDGFNYRLSDLNLVRIQKMGDNTIRQSNAED